MKSGLLLPAILIFSGCQHSITFTEEQKADVANEVRETLTRYCDDVRTSGLTAEFRYLDSTAAFSWVPPGSTQQLAYDTVAAILRRNASKYQMVDNTFETLRIAALSHSIATYTGRLNSNMIETSGINKTFTLIETGVMVKRADGWKLLSGQTAVAN